MEEELKRWRKLGKKIRSTLLRSVSLQTSIDNDTLDKYINELANLLGKRLRKNV